MPFWNSTAKLQRLILDISKKASRTLSPISTHALHFSTSFTDALALKKATKMSETGCWRVKGFGQDNMGECISSHNSTTICCFHYSEETVQRFSAKRRHADCSVRWMGGRYTSVRHVKSCLAGWIYGVGCQALSSEDNHKHLSILHNDESRAILWEEWRWKCQVAPEDLETRALEKTSTSICGLESTPWIVSHM